MGISDAQAAVLWWRQLLTELDSPALTRSAGLDGKRAARRVAQLRELFFKLVTELRLDCLLEVGANQAETSRRFVHENPGGRAVAFEASPDNFRRATQEPLPDRMEMTNCAVGGRTGTVSIFVPQDQRIAGLTSTRRRIDADLKVTEVRVPMITLEEAGRRLPSLSGHRDVALWVDVEGAALEVLTSGPSLITKRVGALYVEVGDRNVYEGGGTVLEILALLSGMNFIPVARDNQYRGAWNLLAVHETAYFSARDTLAQWLYRQMELRKRTAPAE